MSSYENLPGPLLDLMEIVGAPLAALDTRLTMLLANREFITLFKGKLASIPGQSFESISEELEGSSTLVHALFGLVGGGGPFEGFEVKTPSGTFLWSARKVEWPGWHNPIVMLSASRSPESPASMDHPPWERVVGRGVEVSLASTTDFYAVFDADRRVTYANPSLLAACGRREVDIIGRRITELGFSGPLPDHLDDEITRSIETARPVGGRVSSREGELFEDRRDDYLFTPILGSGGRVEAVVGSSRGVSDRSRVESELSEARERMELAKGAMEFVGIWDWDISRDIVVSDERFAQIFSVDFEAASRGVPISHYTRAIHPDDLDRVASAIERALQHGEPFASEYRLIQADGSIRWIAARGGVRRDAEGRPVRFPGVAIDVTERKQAEETLRESENFAKSLVDSSPDTIELIDLDGRLASINRAGRRHRGLAEDETPPGPRSWLDFWMGTDRESAARAVEDARAGRTSGFVGGEPISTGVARRWEVIVAPVLGEAGAIDRLVAISREITDRLAAEEELRRSEARFRQLADAMPQIVFQARPDGVVDYFNRRWYEYTGFREDGQIGDASWVDVHDPESLPQIEERWRQSLHSGEPYEIEYRLRRFDGVYRWHLGRALPVRDLEGRIVRWFGTNTDIDDKKRAEAAALTSRDEAEAANRMKDEFLATLSHELRTPLNAIVGWSKILRVGNHDPGDLEEGLAAIERNGEALSQLIEDLLDVSRIISGQLRLDLHRIDLGGVIDAAIKVVAPAAASRSIRVVKTFDSLVGPILADAARLQQVIWNLLANAVKFTPESGLVQVLLERVETHIEIAVVDSGVGITPEFLPHVFDRFRQADGSTTRRHGGLGLGLAIVKNIVEMHGGSIRAESAGVGRGSTFTVSLPTSSVVREAAGFPRSASPRHSPGAGAGASSQSDRPLAGLKILVVDDEPDARHVVRRVLILRGAEVVLADSATMAILVIEKGLPDVMVSDIGMPEQDGYDLIRRIRRTYSEAQLPAVALTAFARSEDRSQALRAGFQAHIAKPTDPAELATVVAGLAGRTVGRSNQGGMSDDPDRRESFEAHSRPDRR